MKTLLVLAGVSDGPGKLVRLECILKRAQRLVVRVSINCSNQCLKLGEERIILLRDLISKRAITVTKHSSTHLKHQCLCLDRAWPPNGQRWRAAVGIPKLHDPSIGKNLKLGLVRSIYR